MLRHFFSVYIKPIFKPEGDTTNYIKANLGSRDNRSNLIEILILVLLLQSSMEI